DDVQAQSQPARFRVDPPHITSAHVGLGVRPNESAEGEVAFIQRGASSSQIYSFTFLEVRPAIAEAKIDAPLQRFTAGANATDIAVPWRKAPFFNEFLRWIVWREGRAIKALSSASEKPVSLELPTELDSIVRPPLKTTDGPVEVLAVSHDRAHLLLAEFSGRMGEEGSAKLAWNIALPAHPLGITAALEADSSQSYRHIALIAEGSGGFEIFHARYRPGTTPQSFRSTHVAGRPLAGAQPALYIEANGRARVGIIAQPAGSAAVEIVEAVFEPDDSPAKVTIGPPSELPGAPVSGALLYTDRPDVPVRLEGVIEAAGNKLLKLDPALKLIPAPPCTPMSGILLAPGKQTTYTFCTGAERALYISAL
ncbi:MAG TPA: hypothetical protein VHW24_09775, partial [Bryobacteraceae bacterium]|nr:hypothetical protein [Bryobacteraceae bacterium]